MSADQQDSGSGAMGPERDPSVMLPRRSIFRGVAALGGAALLTACGGTGEEPAAGSGAITFKDQRGKTISLDGPARRIVTLPMPAASMLVAVDQGADHLAGMHAASWAAMRDGVMGEMFPQALKVPHDVANQEFAPNVESIVALDPDVVVQWGDHGTEITAPLENAGLKVAGLSYGTQEDVATWIDMFATMLGKPERSRAMRSRIDSSLDRFKKLGSRRPAPAPGILYFLRFAEGLEVAAHKSYNDFYINLVGATNPASGASGPNTGLVEVDKEQVLAWDPDIVLLGNFDSAMPEDLYDDAVWQNLSAVKSRRVYKVPLGGYRWDPPGQESPLMWEWLSDLAFPSQKSRLRAEIVSYYSFLYGQEPTGSQIDEILWMDANAESADYGQFDAS